MAHIRDIVSLNKPPKNIQSQCYIQRWLTEQTNRTEHFRSRVRFVRVRRHIEQNRTVPLFGSCSSGFRTLIPLFGSCSASSDYSKQSRGLCIPRCRTNSWIGKSYYKQWPRKFGGTMAGRTMAEEIPQIQRHRR